MRTIMKQIERKNPKKKEFKVGNPALDIDNFLCFALYSTSKAMTSLYTKYLDQHDVTYPQLLVMIQLWNGDGISINEIGAKVLLDTGTLTPLLKRLEFKGLIERKRSKEDERSVEILLTKEGKNLQTKLKTLGVDMLCDLDLKPEDVVSLAHQLQGIRKRIDSKLK